MDYVRTCDDDRTVETDNSGRKAQRYLPIKWKTNKYSWINWANPTSWINCFDSVHSPQAYVMNQIQLIVICERSLQWCHGHMNYEGLLYALMVIG